MTTDTDTVAAPADWLAAIREAAKRRYRDEHGQPDASVDDRQRPEPATPRNTHTHREAWLHAVAASFSRRSSKRLGRIRMPSSMR
jgi:hypothetical protein